MPRGPSAGAVRRLRRDLSRSAASAARTSSLSSRAPARRFDGAAVRSMFSGREVAGGGAGLWVAQNPSVVAMLQRIDGRVARMAVEGKEGEGEAKMGAKEGAKEGGKEGAKEGAKEGGAEGTVKEGGTKEGQAKAKDDFSKASAGGGGGEKARPGGKSEQEPGGPRGAAIAGQVALVCFLLGMMSLLGRKSDGQEISLQSFVWGLLQKGVVDRVEVVNRSVVRVYLKEGAKREAIGVSVMKGSANSEGFGEEGGSFQERQEAMRYAGDGGGFGNGNGNGGERRAGRGEGDASSQQQEQKGGEAQYYFNIASVDTFERKLSEAQEDMGFAPDDFLSVTYVNEANVMRELMRALPTLVLLGLGVMMMRGAMGSMGGGMGGRGGIFQVGKANPTIVKGGDPSASKMTFGDVAGLDEAKAEVMEFVDFLKNPKRYEKLGAKIPKGALLSGPPGCGKTLLAKATAGEASVPFFSMSGSDFIEMYVGVGPSRVRDLFAQARAAAPCIVFIDEIDAVGRARGRGGFSGGNDERENTLNALLVEMDGFTSSSGVVVLAGTNRADVLDKALLRPGRFDRQISIDKPDIRGRFDVFMVHLQPLKLKGPPETVAKRLAALTPGFSGADIANICNEAALIAAREEKSAVELLDFEKATDRIIGGLEKKNKVISRKEREIVAHHEAGHAIAGWFSKHADPLIKVSIIPRGSAALGFAQYLPVDKFLQSREQMNDFMVMALGGRVAEQLVFGSITTGAQDDLNRITRAVYAQITNYGMSERVGKVNFPRPGEAGAGSQFYKPYSEKTGQMIDEEAIRIVDEAYVSCEALLTTHMVKLKALAARLLEKEVVGEEDLVDVLGERPFSKPVDYDSYVGRFDKDRHQRTGQGRGGDVDPTAKDPATQPPIPVGGAEDSESGNAGVEKKGFPPAEEAIPELC